MNTEKSIEKRRQFPLSIFLKIKKKIVGAIEFGKPIIDSPKEIALMSDQLKESSYDKMIEYFGDKKEVYAIPVEKIYLFEEEISVAEIRNSNIKFVAPQSYLLLKNNLPLLNYLSSRKIKEWK